MGRFHRSIEARHGVALAALALTLVLVAVGASRYQRVRALESVATPEAGAAGGDVLRIAVRGVPVVPAPIIVDLGMGRKRSAVYVSANDPPWVPRFSIGDVTVLPDAAAVAQMETLALRDDGAELRGLWADQPLTVIGQLHDGVISSGAPFLIVTSDLDSYRDRLRAQAEGAFALAGLLLILGLAGAATARWLQRRTLAVARSVVSGVAPGVARLGLSATGFRRVGTRLAEAIAPVRRTVLGYADAVVRECAPIDAWINPHVARVLEVTARPRAWCVRHGLIIVIALAALTRFPTLVATDLSLDETWTWYQTNLILGSGEFWKHVGAGLDAPLFVALDVLITGRYGLSVFSLRLLPALFGVGAVALTFVVFARTTSRGVATMVALLTAASPYLTYYAKTARPYSQLLFFALLFVFAFIATSRSRPVHRTVVLASCAFVTVASHYYGLVFLAGFFVVTAVHHRVTGQRSRARGDLAYGLICLACVSPLILAVAHRLHRLSVSYWVAENDLAGIIAEQFLFLGTTLLHGGALATLMKLAIAGLLALPLVLAIAQRAPVIAQRPLLATLWWVTPLLVIVAGILLGRDLLFYARGFIPTAPFLLGYWVIFTARVRMPQVLRGVYVAGLAVSFALSATLVATSNPAQAYIKNRRVFREIAARVDQHGGDYDVVLVHHWWLAQYFYYYSRSRDAVVALGRTDTEASGSPVGAALADLARVPGTASVLLVLNDLATEHSDPNGEVLAALAARRPIVREIPCRDEPVPGSTILCNRLIFYGPERGEQ